MRSSSPAVERARPLLGTRVAIRVGGLPEAGAHHAIDGAFAAIALIHDRMSFHDPGSDVSRVNGGALYAPVRVHPHTFAVLRWSQRIAAESRGAFDVTVAPYLVRWGVLPMPCSPYRPEPSGSWRDIELLANGAVRFHRPVWIDLGGIAKGYAVDRAIERLRAHGVVQACVNAGGDLRVIGPRTERIRLRVPGHAGRRLIPVLDIEDASVASSAGRVDHLHGARRRPVGSGSFACVVAERCIVADALTKVVLAQGTRSLDLLRRFGAAAHLHRAASGWRSLNARS